MKPKHFKYVLVEIKKIMTLFMTVVKDQQPNQMMLVPGPGSPVITRSDNLNAMT